MSQCWCFCVLVFHMFSTLYWIELELAHCMVTFMSTRKLLQLLELDRHLSGRTQMEQSSASPPMLLCTFISKEHEGGKLISRKHYHANSTSTYLL
eukprot:c23097_g3_i4 orf=135-419(+)